GVPVVPAAAEEDDVGIVIMPPEVIVPHGVVILEGEVLVAMPIVRARNVIVSVKFRARDTVVGHGVEVLMLLMEFVPVRGIGRMQVLHLCGVIDLHLVNRLVVNGVVGVNRVVLFERRFVHVPLVDRVGVALALNMVSLDMGVGRMRVRVLL